MKKIFFLASVLFLFSVTPAFAATTTPATSTIPCTVLPYDLEIGAKDIAPSTSVADLQAFLIASGYLADAEIKGYYASSTATAVKAFQAAKAILQTGVAGPITRIRIQDVSCPPNIPITKAPEPSPKVYNPAEPPPFEKTKGLNPIKILHKKGAKTNDGFIKHYVDLLDREGDLNISWWRVRVYCEKAVVRFGEDFEYGCGEETDPINSSKTKKGNITKYRIDAAADGTTRGRVTIRAWAFNSSDKLVGENRVYFWVR